MRRAPVRLDLQSLFKLLGSLRIIALSEQELAEAGPGRNGIRVESQGLLEGGSGLRGMPRLRESISKCFPKLRLEWKHIGHPPPGVGGALKVAQRFFDLRQALMKLPIIRRGGQGLTAL